MIVAIADTHAAIWYAFANPRLSATARAVIERAAAAGNQVGVATITFAEAEMVYLIEKGRIPNDAFARLSAILDAPDSELVEVPFIREIAAAMFGVARQRVPDMPDRIIAATALYLGLPLISRDGRIRASGMTTTW